jgi:predicted cupin superfamily sugar epimerase/RimJ/RimL family protein N-acetyltransferase
MVHVRPAVAADAAAWSRMRAALWPGEDAAQLAAEVGEYFAGELHEPLAGLLAIDERGVPVGVAELSIRNYAEGCDTNRVAYLEAWYVVPEGRRQGVGRALIAAAEEWARARGCREFASDALLDNEVSALAHRALGFEETEQIRCFRKAIAAPLNARAVALIRDLQLTPHPEGGHYRELFRSDERVTAADGRVRAAVTTIYYLLQAGEHSRWHRVSSDEVWHFCEGDPLDLMVLSADHADVRHHRLGAIDAGGRHTVTVRTGEWQAARPTGEYALAGCTVSPGFDFADFAMARDLPDVAAAIRARHPGLALLL